MENLTIIHIQPSPDPYLIDKPESKTKVPSPKLNRKGKEEFGLWTVSKILWSHPPNPTHPITFKHEGGI